MPTYNLANGDDFVEIEVGGNYYFKPGNFTVGTSFTLNSAPVTPGFVDEVEADGASTVNTQSKYPVIDNLGNQMEKIIGQRPPKKPRS